MLFFFPSFLWRKPKTSINFHSSILIEKKPHTSISSGSYYFHLKKNHNPASNSMFIEPIKLDSTENTYCVKNHSYRKKQFSLRYVIFTIVTILSFLLFSRIPEEKVFSSKVLQFNQKKIRNIAIDTSFFRIFPSSFLWCKPGGTPDLSDTFFFWKSFWNHP